MAVIAQKCSEIKVTVVDINDQRIADWNDENLDKLPIYESGLKEAVAEARGRNLFFSTDVDKEIDEAEMIFSSVNTPTKTYGKGKVWLQILLCARQIAKVSKTYKIFSEKSTLLPNIGLRSDYHSMLLGYN
jgi:UDPglucose 6-dehydrogenase